MAFGREARNSLFGSGSRKPFLYSCDAPDYNRSAGSLVARCFPSPPRAAVPLWRSSISKPVVPSLRWPYFFVRKTAHSREASVSTSELGGVDDQQQRNDRQDTGRKPDGQKPYQIIPAGFSGIPFIAMSSSRLFRFRINDQKPPVESSLWLG